MLEIVTAGLVVALVVLLIVRSTQRPPAAPSDPSAERTFAPPTTGMPPTPPHAVEVDIGLWESRRIARRGEDRAASLDLFGYLLIGLVALIVVVVPATLVGSSESTTADERVVIVLGTAGAMLFVSALAAVFFGLGAIVRKTSRSLAIAADRALDLTDPIDDE